MSAPVAAPDLDSRQVLARPGNIAGLRVSQVVLARDLMVAVIWLVLADRSGRSIHRKSMDPHGLRTYLGSLQSCDGVQKVASEVSPTLPCTVWS